MRSRSHGEEIKSLLTIGAGSADIARLDYAHRDESRRVGTGAVFARVGAEVKEETVRNIVNALGLDHR